jgi:hypothetical protein
MAKQWHQLERLDHRALKKLQVDREKQAANVKADADKRRYMFIGAAVGFAVILFLVFLMIIRSRAAQREFQAAREQLLFSQVTQFSGSVFFSTFGDWEALVDEKYRFDKEYAFKTEKGGLLTIELQLKNTIKLASESEVVVYPPTLEEKENKVKKERVKVTRGDVSVMVGADGREILEIEAGGVFAIGASGLFKVIYNPQKNMGEIVVKNGLVEVYAGSNPSKKIKVSGFYKVTFKNGELSAPSQASIIQYDWR